MSRSLKQFLKLTWQSLLFWSIAMGLFIVFRFYGQGQQESVSLSEVQILTSIKNIIRYAFYIGFFLGLLYAIIEFIFERVVTKNLSLGLGLVLKTVVYFIATIAIFTIVLEILSDLNRIIVNNEVGWWLRNQTFHAILVYIFVCSLAYSFLRIATERFGSGIFLKMLMGKYKVPKEEKRIFMFLDLKDSTTIAEKLGHFKYSQFIQDCFYDLNEVVPKYDAEIYQYVGDEAVLCWPYEKGIAGANCINVFFAFQLQNLARAGYYATKYGVVPEFKAGVHGGVLMLAEVGFVKKELAYHGDVINTTARIQGECNNHRVSFLISEVLLNDLKISDSFTSLFLGTVLLKGKNKEINIHTIKEAFKM